ncbi:carboxymuconolactone decarboxylase family protein (plasmid) [Gemmobacter fulvus]|uniref:Carboxymuconolactone decarboxylase family protein n=1 Tax=Gemmobacter fulvus TaxID=2840474 RepID=A0A975P9S4_9RHOB|nr:carboxymuconolactone decarboxylase family protein [Gemmobacter fulvus]MBT9246234.1 carboxymuconolactone decarboxylase family protein [Gemmobacter fulvus]MDQ1850197.1 carboxymuconolactone decarboxylase family protein [Gemmobacter fulvus]QWK92410.1 carboxymuconolactone decarboxylase family protein [Gemmobacter fulvus]
MPRIDPLPRQDLAEYEPIFQGMVNSIGYVPNSFLTMARDPGLLNAVGAMSDAIWYPDTVDEPLRRLVTFAYSHYAGSYYSSAHCACGAEELGLAREKIMAIFEYETAPVYTEAERAVLRLCRHAARIPGEVTDADVEAVKAHYGVQVATFIAGMICYMAFLNKWNEIAGTRLEDVPYEWASANLRGLGWTLTQ